MHCLVIYKEDYPWDVRVEKIAKSLFKAGHDVVIVSRNLSQKKSVEVVDGIKVYRLPRTERLPNFLQRIVNMPLWFNPFWIYLLLKTTTNRKDCILIVRDLPLILAGYFVCKVRKAKLIFDMAECYPEMYSSSAKFSSRPLTTRIMKSPFIAKVYEQIAIKLVDHTFVMIEESYDRLVRFGIDTNKVTVISNTPPVSKYKEQSHVHSGDKLRIIYIGFITKIRGLDILIRSAYEYIRMGQPPESLRIDIVGVGAFKDQLQKMVKQLELTKCIYIHGWLDQSDIDKLMDDSNIGALTYRVCSHWNHTIPNKIFDYMLYGLPVLATEVIPISRIIRSTDCGIICRDQDPEDIAEQLIKLRDPRLRAHYGNNGKEAILNQYNWENDENRLLAVIKRFETKH